VEIRCILFLTQEGWFSRRLNLGTSTAQRISCGFANGELLTCEPAEVLPMAQRYFLL
jgi:hypothetical protein